MTNINRKISSLETRIAALNERIAGYKTAPEYIARTLSLSPRITCMMTGEARIAYLPTANVWVSRENGKWRARPDKQIASLFRNLLKQEQGIAITARTASSVEQAARKVFARAEFPAGAA